MAYYKNSSGELEHFSYIAVSDHRKHVTATFHAFQKRFVPFLQNKLAEKGLKCGKICYFSDGSSAQYKNRKNVKNMCLHKTDFDGIEVEWHYFASCHSKGPCDGVGGTVKRCALRASLRKTLIRNAQEMCEWAENNLPHIKVECFTEDEVSEVVQLQEERFKNVEALTGITKYHTVIPQTATAVLMKRYSESEESQLMHLVKTRSFVPWDSLTEYVLVATAEKWKLAKIQEKNPETQELTVVFLNPPGRSRYYKFPEQQQAETISWENVLTTTTPKHSRTSLSISVEDKNVADKELKLYKGM